MLIILLVRLPQFACLLPATLITFFGKAAFNNCWNDNREIIIYWLL